MSDMGGTPRALPSVPLEPLRDRDPRALGPFRLLGRLGAGGMGVAYLSESGGDWSVVKMLRSELAEDRSHRARIGRELEAMKRASGPHTAKLLEEHLDEDPSWFAMEFIPGTTLTRRVEDAGPLTPPEVTDLATSLAHVLEDIHAAGVIHRDLKPSNIMLAPTGPKIIDFGIADLADGTQLTRTGSVMGSTGWLAPEQITGAQVTTSTDVHAWGLCVLFAATGHAPFDGGTASSSLYRVLESTPDVPDYVTEPLRALIEGALSKDATRRPTVTQLLSALDPPIPPPPPLPPPPPPAPETLVISPTDQWTEERGPADSAHATTPLAARPEPLPKVSPKPSPLKASRKPLLIIVAIIGMFLLGGLAIGLISSATRQTDSSKDPEGTTEVVAKATPSPSSEISPSGDAEDSRPASSTPASAPATDEAPIAATVAYSIWVDQEDPIPDQIVKNSLDWQVDLCSPDAAIAASDNVKKIALLKKVDGKWVRQATPANVEAGDRCGKQKVHIVMDVSEPPPAEDRLGKGWGKCTDYRVVIPETKNFAKTYVDICVRARSDEESEGA